MEFNIEPKTALKLMAFQPSRRERKRPTFIAHDWFDEILDMLQQYVGDHMLAVVVDEEVARLYPERLDALYNSVPRMRTLKLPSGEPAKQIEAYKQVVEFLIENELQGDDRLLSIGGGTISDLSGFVASTYMRGMPWLSMPTTLIAQADCAVGGKTALNMGSLKDYIGTFYWPNAIFVDTKFLDTLPDKQFRVSVPELAKVGLIGNAELFKQLSAAVGDGGGVDALRNKALEFLHPAIMVKSEVTRRDPYQEDLRAVLLTGHTTAHALESASRLHLHHGEAVGIGLAFESFLAEKRGLIGGDERKMLIDILEDCGLPTALPSELHDRMLVDNMRREKRNRGRSINMILPYRLGKAIDEWPAPKLELSPDAIWSELAAYRVLCA